MEQVKNVEFSLFHPGMGPFHRAGLAGLASTLSYIEKAAERGDIRPKDLPGDWSNGVPWKIHKKTIEIAWGDNPELFVEKLLKIAFQIRDGLAYMPGKFHDKEPPIAVQIALHEGLLKSFWDQSKAKKTGPIKIQTLNVDDKEIPIQYRSLEWYKPQKYKLSDNEVNSHVMPGAAHPGWRSAAAALSRYYHDA